MPGNCVFNLTWTQDPKFRDWLLPSKDIHKGHCKYCKRDFVVTTMGITAVNSHMKTGKHKKLTDIIKGNTQITATSSITLHASTSAGTGNNTHTPPGTSSGTTGINVCASVDSYATKNDVLTAEIWWGLKSVTTNASFHSNEDTGFIFRKMFPSDPVVGRFTCGETKTMYLTCFGLAPYFLSLLESRVKQNEYVMLFDESLNKQLQKNQLDIYLRFWYEGQVKTRYYDSQFLGHARADDLVESCMSSLTGLGCSYSKIIQVSMDGPNVNWAFFRKFSENIQEDSGARLLDIGSCGLHKLHNAFRAAATATKWQLSDYLSSLYILLHNVPARREDYEKSAGCDVLKYPLKFCPHRWVENAKVAERAIAILPDVKAFVSEVLKSSKQNINTKSFEVVSHMVADKLLAVKLATFVSIAKAVEGFLVSYQSDKPMVPYICEDLCDVLKKLMTRFVKPDVLKAANSAYKLIRVDITNSENLKPHNKIDAGFISDKLLDELRAEKKISERQILEFHMETREFLQCLVSKMIKKSPIEYSLVRNMSCLTPSVLLDEPEVGAVRFRRVLSLLSSSKRVNDKDCDRIIEQYNDFAREMKSDRRFTEFSKSEGSLDKLYHSAMVGDTKWNKLWSVVSSLLLLSHGQATVERGFSVNKQCADDNLSERNLKCRRLIKDHVASVGGLGGVEVTPEMLKAAAASRTKYEEHIRSVKVAKEKIGQMQKRKSVEEDLANLKKQKKGLEDDIAALEQSADELAVRAETSRNLTFVTRSNNDRKRMKEKQTELSDMSERINAKSKVLRNM